MQARIIQIGNSQGIRLPKALLEQSGISGEVELELHESGILIRNAEMPRSGWDIAFKAMAENDAEDAVEALPNEFEKKEWQW
ncbi:MAG: AbrB/MazE/SpoVT family DNA-binding domain-containing protein [Acidobacteria bacterium]|nr:AbrB/MazE/SpoVT family DNA-binding domain-containing protein [Acidobacteriota bacterium]